MSPLLFTFNAAASLSASLTARLGADAGHCTQRSFPDGERYLRLDSDVTQRSVVLLCGLEQPDRHLLSALFFADTARELGARQVGLVTPYLPYMRQDKRFQPGEAVTSRSFAALLSHSFDWLATVDPHLHRYRHLGEIYTIPTRTVAAAPALAKALSDCRDSFLLGPDAESEQWVAAIGRDAGLPWAIADKQRLGDRNVEIALPSLAHFSGKTPILIDDVISSGTTVRNAARQLRQCGFNVSRCLCTHPLFAENAVEMLHGEGIDTISSCNTIDHDSNAIDIGPLLAEAVIELIDQHA